MVWFDGQWEQPYTRELSIDLNNYLRHLAPTLVINDRINSTKLQAETREATMPHRSSK